MYEDMTCGINFSMCSSETSHCQWKAYTLFLMQMIYTQLLKMHMLIPSHWL